MARFYGATKPKHDFSNTMVLIPGWHAAAMKRMARAVPDSHLAEDGREMESHVTVKYGLSDNTPPKRLISALAGFGPVTAKFGKTSLFKNEDAHVVKIDIDSPDLQRLNKLIGRTVETPGNTHPTYIPHGTIAYVKPEHSAKYEGDKTLHGQEVTFDHVIFSGKDGVHHKIPLGEKRPSYRAT